MSTNKNKIITITIGCLAMFSAANIALASEFKGYLNTGITSPGLSGTVVTNPPAPAVSTGGGGGGGSSSGRQTTTMPMLSTGGQVLGASTGFQFTRNLSLGMSGDDVSQLQNMLTTGGFYSGPITGYFGNLTQAAVKKFQAANGLPQTGFVGPLTITKLNGAGQVAGASADSTGSLQAGGMSVEQMKALLAQLQAQLAELLKIRGSN